MKRTVLKIRNKKYLMLYLSKMLNNFNIVIIIGFIIPVINCHGVFKVSGAQQNISEFQNSSGKSDIKIHDSYAQVSGVKSSDDEFLPSDHKKSKSIKNLPIIVGTTKDVDDNLKYDEIEKLNITFNFPESRQPVNSHATKNVDTNETKAHIGTKDFTNESKSSTTKNPEMITIQDIIVNGFPTKFKTMYNNSAEIKRVDETEIVKIEPFIIRDYQTNRSSNNSKRVTSENVNSHFKMFSEEYVDISPTRIKVDDLVAPNNMKLKSKDGFEYLRQQLQFYSDKTLPALNNSKANKDNDNMNNSGEVMKMRVNDNQFNLQASHGYSDETGDAVVAQELFIKVPQFTSNLSDFQRNIKKETSKRIYSKLNAPSVEIERRIRPGTKDEIHLELSPQTRISRRPLPESDKIQGTLSKEEKHFYGDDELLTKNERSFKRYDRPAVAYKRTIIRNERPVPTNVKSIERNERLAIRNEKPVMRKESAAMKKERLVSRNERPILRNEKRPMMRNETPITENERPILRIGSPVLENARPVIRYERLLQTGDEKPLPIRNRSHFSGRNERPRLIRNEKYLQTRNERPLSRNKRPRPVNGTDKPLIRYERPSVKNHRPIIWNEMNRKNNGRPQNRIKKPSNKSQPTRNKSDTRPPTRKYSYDLRLPAGRRRLENSNLGNIHINPQLMDIRKHNDNSRDVIKKIKPPRQYLKSELYSGEIEKSTTTDLKPITSNINNSNNKGNALSEQSISKNNFPVRYGQNFQYVANQPTDHAQPNEHYSGKSESTVYFNWQPNDLPTSQTIAKQSEELMYNETEKDFFHFEFNPRFKPEDNLKLDFPYHVERKSTHAQLTDVKVENNGSDESRPVFSLKSTLRKNSDRLASKSELPVFNLGSLLQFSNINYNDTTVLHPNGFKTNGEQHKQHKLVDFPNLEMKKNPLNSKSKISPEKNNEFIQIEKDISPQMHFNEGTTPAITKIVQINSANNNSLPKSDITLEHLNVPKSPVHLPDNNSEYNSSTFSTMNHISTLNDSLSDPEHLTEILSKIPVSLARINAQNSKPTNPLLHHFPNKNSLLINSPGNSGFSNLFDIGSLSALQNPLQNNNQFGPTQNIFKSSNNVKPISSGGSGHDSHGYLGLLSNLGGGFNFPQTNLGLPQTAPNLLKSPQLNLPNAQTPNFQIAGLASGPNLDTSFIQLYLNQLANSSPVQNTGNLGKSFLNLPSIQTK